MRILCWCRGRQNPYEGCKFLNIAQHIEAGLIGIRRVIRGRLELTLRILLPLGLEQLVGNTHLYVVCFACECQQGFVMRLPSKPSNGTVISVSIFESCERVTRVDDVHPPPYTIRIASLRRVIIENNLVWNLFDQSPSECWSRNSEDHVITSEFPNKVWLLQNAPVSVLKSRNGENRMDTTIGGLSIRIKLEPRLAYRALPAHEPWKSLGLLQILFVEIELWIEVRRTCAADRRIAVTAGAAVEVHSRPQAVSLDFVTLLELRGSRLEQVQLTTCY